MKGRVGDEKLIISVAVRGINDQPGSAFTQRTPAALLDSAQDRLDDVHLRRSAHASLGFFS